MHPEPTEKELRLVDEMIRTLPWNASKREVALAALRAERELAAKYLDDAPKLVLASPAHAMQNTPQRCAAALRNQEHLP